MYYTQRHRIHSHESSRWSRTTPGQGNIFALTCSKNSHDAEAVSCAENTLRIESGTDTIPVSKWFIPDPVATSSSIVVYRFQASGFPPPSYQLRVHVIFTALVARMHFWFWHIATLVLVFASASRILWSICLCTGQDSMSNRVPCNTSFWDRICAVRAFRH